MRTINTVSALLLGLLPHTLATINSAAYLFQGNSIAIFPSNHSRWPQDAQFVAANFYCYATPIGYFSFGWWLDASKSTNHTHCGPTAPEIDWYEYTLPDSGSCDEESGKCRFRAKNIPLTKDPLRPDIDDDYVFSVLDIGRGDIGTLALSYIDKEGGMYGVGTRRIISASQEGRTDEEQSECTAAYQRLEHLWETRDVPVAFRLHNPCGKDSAMRQQRPLVIQSS